MDVDETSESYKQGMVDGAQLVLDAVLDVDSTHYDDVGEALSGVTKVVMETLARIEGEK